MLRCQGLQQRKSLFTGHPSEGRLKIVLREVKAPSFPGGSVVRDPPASAGDAGSIPGSGRSPEEGNNNPLQYSMDREAW